MRKKGVDFENTYYLLFFFKKMNLMLLILEFRGETKEHLKGSFFVLHAFLQLSINLNNKCLKLLIEKKIDVAHLRISKEKHKKV